VCVRGGYGVVVPLTFSISCSICVYGLSNHIVHSCTKPVPWAFFSVITSPLSWICSPHRRAYLYTSALLLYSNIDKDKLPLIGPLLLLIAAYRVRRAAFDAQSMAMR
jgi:hypothetical protein